MKMSCMTQKLYVLVTIGVQLRIWLIYLSRRQSKQADLAWVTTHMTETNYMLMQAATAGGSSLVTSLSTLGTTVAACSFMSSLSLFTTAGHEGKAGLEPLSANICLMTAQGDSLHNGPIQVQSAGILNGQFLLAGAYPDGLLLLKRDVAQEEATCRARRSAKEKALLEGQHSMFSCCSCCLAVVAWAFQ